MNFLLSCSTNLTTSEKKNISIIPRLSTFINCKQQIPRGNIHWKNVHQNQRSGEFSIADARRQGGWGWMHSAKILIRWFKIDGEAFVALFSGTICDKVMIFFLFHTSQREEFISTVWNSIILLFEQWNCFRKIYISTIIYFTSI